MGASHGAQLRFAGGRSGTLKICALVRATGEACVL